MNEKIEDLLNVYKKRLNAYKKRVELLNKVTEDILKLVEPPYKVNSRKDFDNELKELMKRYEIDIDGDEA